MSVVSWDAKQVVETAMYVIQVGALLSKVASFAKDLFQKIWNWCSGNGFKTNTELQVSDVRQMMASLSFEERARIRTLLGLD